MDDEDRIFAVGTAFIAFVVLLSVPAFVAAQVVAEYVGASGHPRITLYDAPCRGVAQAAVMHHIQPRYHARFRGAESQFRMRDGSVRNYGACWARVDPPEAAEPVYVVLFEDNDYVILPVREFRDQRTLQGRTA